MVLSVSVLERLARELFVVNKVASAVVTGVSALAGRAAGPPRSARAGRLAMGEDETAVTPPLWFDLAVASRNPHRARGGAARSRGQARPRRSARQAATRSASERRPRRAPLELLLAHRAGLESHRRSTRVCRRQGSRAAASRSSKRPRRPGGPCATERCRRRLCRLLQRPRVPARRRERSRARAMRLSIEVSLNVRSSAPLGAAMGSAQADSRACTRASVADVAATEVVAWRGGDGARIRS